MIKDGRFDLIQLKRGNDLLRPEIRVSYRVFFKCQKSREARLTLAFSYVFSNNKTGKK